MDLGKLHIFLTNIKGVFDIRGTNPIPSLKIRDPYCFGKETQELLALELLNAEKSGVDTVDYSMFFRELLMYCQKA